MRNATVVPLMYSAATRKEGNCTIGYHVWEFNAS